MQGQICLKQEKLYYIKSFLVLSHELNSTIERQTSKISNEMPSKIIIKKTSELETLHNITD